MEVRRHLEAPAALSLEKETLVPTHRIGDWVSPQLVWTLWSGEKSLASAGNTTPAFQSVACHYTN
jgi:hypothetical protein